ncbi:transposase [Desulfurobacterium indicum]|uniref:Transposase n=1 Tax=Desulfurobacterium indicum TaxID=1914305 RepID=A0A1R1MJ53_9BACT|nr:transposase [Desulfurobacterium indicum]OMH39821.1 transposase [Desulfurobacterium indicum]
MGKRKNYSPEFKAKVAIEAIKGEKIISQIASEFGIHPVLVTKWKKQFLENSHKVFSAEGNKEKELQKTIDELYKQIGQLKVEKDFLSRKLGLL